MKEKNSQAKSLTSSATLPWTSPEFKLAWAAWLEYKREAHKFTYKTLKSEQAALVRLSKISLGYEQTAIEIIELSISNNWKGLFPTKTKADAAGKRNYASRRAGQYQALDALGDKLLEDLTQLDADSTTRVTGP